jgi:hypothetical protein
MLVVNSWPPATALCTAEMTRCTQNASAMAAT